jgi:hypothetical protein
MVKKYLLIFCCAMTLFSCTNLSFKSKKTEVTYVMDNEVLENEIALYMDSVLKNKNKMINIKMRTISDTTCFDIRYCLSAETIIDAPSTYFINTKKGLISITYLKYPSSNSFESIEYFKMSIDDAWEILKDYYPEEYQYYLRNDSIVYGIPTGGGEVWRLKFKNNEYLGKEIYWER